MAHRASGVKRHSSSKASVASASKFQKRKLDDVESLVGEGSTVTRASSRGTGSRRSIGSILQEEVDEKKLLPNSTHPCEMQAAPNALKGPSAICHWGKCASSKDALNFS